MFYIPGNLMHFWQTERKPYHSPLLFFEPYPLGHITVSKVQHWKEHHPYNTWLISHDMTDRFRLDKVHILDLQTDSIQPLEQAFKAITPFTSRNIRYVYSDAHKNIWILRSIILPKLKSAGFNNPPNSERKLYFKLNPFSKLVPIPSLN